MNAETRQTIALAQAALDAAERLIRAPAIRVKNAEGAHHIALPADTFDALREAIFALRGPQQEDRT